jgi:flavin-dependent dehydrogenase
MIKEGPPNVKPEGESVDYDVIVAGASFAGLAVASAIKGDVLLIDRKEIGSVPTSACGTFLKTLKESSTMDSLCQVLPRVRFFTATSKNEFVAPYPFCTFDYRIFCEILASTYKGDFLLAKISGVEKDRIITDRGTFSGKCLVDCTGWRAVLASAVEPDFSKEEKLGFAIETQIEGFQDDALHFFIDPSIIDHGLAWIFPAGRQVHFGVGSYTGEKDLVPNLRELVARYGLSVGSIHGGYLPCGLRRATIHHIFLVGDSAGQVLPVSGEGIRQALFFGRKCASLIQKVIDEEISRETALAIYDGFVREYKLVYDFLLRVQEWLARVPNKRVHSLARLAGPRPLAGFLQARYAKFMSMG